MKTPKRQISFLEANEVRQIIESIKPKEPRDLRDRALIEVLFSTGLRISEALALPDAPFMKNDKKTLELIITGKGGWQRVVYFSPKALQAVRDYMTVKEDSDMLLFPITVRTAQVMVKKRAKTAGIEKRVSPHVFRHSLATDLLRRGVDIAFVSKFLGHRSLNNTMIYAHIVSPQLLEIHKKLYK